jgi:hypothetical protein
MKWRMLVGSKVPVILALLDVCLDCGAVYAVRLERSEVPLTAVVVQSPPGQPPFMPPGMIKG